MRASNASIMPASLAWTLALFDPECCSRANRLGRSISGRGRRPPGTISVYVESCVIDSDVMAVTIRLSPDIGESPRSSIRGSKCRTQPDATCPPF
jgi:hypothetical protein